MIYAISQVKERVFKFIKFAEHFFLKDVSSIVRKILAIPLIVLILFSGISIKFATHYCQGSVFATRVSLTGQLATCGMEHHEDHNLSQESITSECCDDVLSAYTLSNNYLGSTFHIDNPNLTGTYFVFMPFHTEVVAPITHVPSYSNIRPPGMNDLYTPAIQTLCVFRI